MTVSRENTPLFWVAPLLTDIYDRKEAEVSENRL